MGQNLLDSASFFAEFEFSRAEFESAHELLVDGTSMVAPVQTPESFFQMVKVAATVEHETFHCRHLLSSSMGYLLYWVRQRIFNEKAMLLPVIPPGTLRRGLLPSTKVPKQMKAHVMELFLHQSLLRVLFQFSPSDIDHFYVHEENFPHDPAKEGTHVPLLVRISRPGNAEFDTYSHSASLADLIEGIALWKEYAYVSYLVAKHYPRHLGSLTLEWLQQADQTMRYRRAADLIAEAAGCNMSTALSGALMDLALAGSYFSLRERTWNEIHPSLRFAKILSVAGQLPKSLKTADALEPLDEGFFREVEERIRMLLGWQPLEETMREALSAVQCSARGIAKACGRSSPPPLNALYERRFELALATRLKSPGVFLFPAASRDSRVIGQLTLPVGRAFKNEIQVLPWHDEPSVLMLLYLDDVILTRFLEAFMNDNVFSEFSQPRFHRARQLYAARQTAFSDADVRELKLKCAPTFDEFVSKQLHFDYAAERASLLK